MKIDEAIKIASKEGSPVYAIESENYFVFTLGGESGDVIANDASFVVDKRKGAGKWVHMNGFPLKDGGKLLGEYSDF